MRMSLLALAFDQYKAGLTMARLAAVTGSRPAGAAAGKLLITTPNDCPVPLYSRPA